VCYLTHDTPSPHRPIVVTGFCLPFSCDQSVIKCGEAIEERSGCWELNNRPESGEIDRRPRAIRVLTIQ